MLDVASLKGPVAMAKSAMEHVGARNYPYRRSDRCTAHEPVGIIARNSRPVADFAIVAAGSSTALSTIQSANVAFLMHDS